MSNRLNSIIFGQRRPYSAHAEKFCDGTHTHICRFIYFRNIDALKVHLRFGFGLLRGVFFGVARDRAIAASREKVIGEDYAYLKFIYTMYYVYVYDSVQNRCCRCHYTAMAMGCGAFASVAQKFAFSDRNSFVTSELIGQRFRMVDITENTRQPIYNYTKKSKC